MLLVRARAAGTTPGLAIATYDMTEDGLHITVGFEVSGEIPAGIQEVVMPAAGTPSAACTWG
jgi:hypothetical protein